MTRAAMLFLAMLVLAAVAAGCSGCGGTSATPSSEARPATRPVRIASHETEAAPEAPTEYQAEGATIEVTSDGDGTGPHADPPPVEPPSFD